MPVSAFLRASFDEAYSIFGLTEALSSDLHSGPQRRERRAAKHMRRVGTTLRPAAPSPPSHFLIFSAKLKCLGP